MILLAAISCEKSETSQFEAPFDRWIGEGGKISVTASNGEPGSKTLLQSGSSVYWSPEDSISVFYGPYNMGKFTSLNDEPAQTTVFRSDATFSYGTFGGSAYKFTGINPYNAANAVEGNSVILSIPSQQQAVSGTFDPVSFPSIAHSDNLEMAFYNTCGGLRFKVVNSGITNVSFRGNNGEILAGKVKFGIDTDGLPEVEEHLDSVTTVSLVCPSGLVPDQWYFISLLPATLSKGFTIDLSNGTKTVSYVSERDTEIKRSIFGSLSNVDEGLSLEQDWKQCDFVHRSLMLAVPNCLFSYVFVSDENEAISQAKKLTGGNMEVIQVFANGPAPTEGVSALTSLMNITSVPFVITDYRQKTYGSATPYSTYLSTPKLYGTTSGIAVNSYYTGDELTVEASLYIKEADEYKIVVALVQDDAEYAIYYNSGKTTTMTSQGVTRYLLTSITGDPLTAASDGTILYRSYRQTITDASFKKKLRVLVYVLRPYGSRTVTSNGSFGSYYVDNAFSALAGYEAELPVVKKINSEIGAFEYGGTIGI